MAETEMKLVEENTRRFISMDFHNIGKQRHWLPTRMWRFVQWLELEHRLEALVRPLGISDELHVQI